MAAKRTLNLFQNFQSNTIIQIWATFFQKIIPGPKWIKLHVFVKNQFCITVVPTLAAAAKMTVGKTVPAFRASLLLRGLGGRDDDCV